MTNIETLPRKARNQLAISRPGKTEAADSWRAFALAPGRAPHLVAIGYEGAMRALALTNGATVSLIAIPDEYSVSSPPAIYRPGHGTGPFETTLPPSAILARENAGRRVGAPRNNNYEPIEGPRPYGQRAS